jgi:hypothetical protein
MKKNPDFRRSYLPVAAMVATACALSWTPVLFAETTVGGIIEKDARWTAEKGPYYVAQDVLVTRRARLSISPGTQIIVCKPVVREKTIRQMDALDSSTVAITVEGALDCAGRPDKRITFVPQEGGRGCSWYGIVFKNATDQYTELGYTDISGAYNAVSVTGCGPVIHHCQIDFNNAGVVCGEHGDASVYNCVIAYNYTAGIKVASANPILMNNIIAFNRNNGVWCDGASKITFEYNCLFGNADGNLLDCDPELGVLKKKNDRKDSTDYKNNIFKNPIFAGSEYDSVAVERDVSLPTDKSRIRDTSLAKVLHEKLADSLASKKRAAAYAQYSLSRYSPCIHAASPSQEFHNMDGSRGDMGMYGATKFSPARKK